MQKSLSGGILIKKIEGSRISVLQLEPKNGQNVGQNCSKYMKKPNNNTNLEKSFFVKICTKTGV